MSKILIKIFLTLLLLIPSLSWGEYLNLKDVPTSKKELNYLFGFNIGDVFDKSLFTVEGNIKDREPYKDENYPYKTFSNYSSVLTEDEFEIKIYNNDFESFNIVLDKDYKILGLNLKQEFKNEKLTSQLSDLMETFDLDIFKNYGGLSEISFSNCADFSSKVIKAYKFKRKIDDKFQDKYFYTTFKESEELADFIFISSLKDKEGRVVTVECSYITLLDKELNSYFNFTISSPEFYEARNTMFMKNFNEFYNIYEVAEEEFKEILQLATDIMTDGL